MKEFLKEVVSIVVGKQAEPIADLLYSKNHVNEFVIAKKLDLTINQTRNILYKIFDQGLVTSIRKKDKKKGWYTYFWKIEVLKSLEFLRGVIQKKIDLTQSQISNRESRRYYVCEHCNIELSEENAMHQDFLCNECGEVLTLKDDTKLIKELKKNLDKFKEKLELVDKEISKEQEVVDKQKDKEKKKLEKEAAERRAEKREARKKLAKKTVKEDAKKKPVKKKASKKTSKKKVAKKVVKKAVKKKVTKKAAKKKVVKKKTVKKTVKKATKKTSSKKKK